ncbi:MAG: hypothetical protein AB9860_01385 [Methanomassiliicoccales archaeon]
MDRLTQIAQAMGFAIIAVFAWLALMPDLGGFVILVFTFILVYWLYKRDKRKETIVLDERKRALRNKATRVSWWFTIEMVAIVFLLNWLDIIRPSFVSLAVLVVGFMIGSQLFLELYYNRAAES